ncbi:MAG: hypothetical protein HZB25_14165 [Candidatus Eisenbacteria bacterium]|nr:hypothetical protein [Candidatus Eisenbacteria bacterium]
MPVQRIPPLSALLSLLALLLVPAAPALGAAHDPPALAVVAVGHGKVLLSITAGASGAPAGFAVWWMKRSDFLAGGNLWAESGTSPAQGEAYFIGSPSLFTLGGLCTSYLLAPGAPAQVPIGDLFDETGVSTNAPLDLDPATAYVFRAFALAGGGGEASEASQIVFASTLANVNCTQTMTWWLNHLDQWPLDEGQSALQASRRLGARPAGARGTAASTIPLGSTAYTKDQLVAILGAVSGIGEPDIVGPRPGMLPAMSAGNGLIALAHQLITARCNELNGATVPAVVQAAMTDADALIGALVVPPLGSGYLEFSVCVADWQVLSDYNHGLIGPGGCVTTPVKPQTWGQLKTRYR